jgi:hypothetical protein
MAGEGRFFIIVEHTRYEEKSLTKIIHPEPLQLASLDSWEVESTPLLNRQKQARNALRKECLPGVILYLAERGRGVDEHDSYIAYSVHKLRGDGSLLDITEFVAQAATNEITSWKTVPYGADPERIALVCHLVDPTFICYRLGVVIWARRDVFDIQII